MEVTFGAVGDFISIGLLIKDLVELLDDSRGSSWEYRALTQQLKVLRQVVDQADSFCHQHCDSADFQDIQDDLEGIIQEAKRRIDGVVEKIRKYSINLSQGGSKNVAKDTARKVQWRLEKKEIEKFRDDVLRYTASIQTLLVTVTG
jgi:hypothetical protein